MWGAGLSGRPWPALCWRGVGVRQHFLEHRRELACGEGGRGVAGRGHGRGHGRGGTAGRGHGPATSMGRGRLGLAGDRNHALLFVALYTQH